MTSADAATTVRALIPASSGRPEGRHYVVTFHFHFSLFTFHFSLFTFHFRDLPGFERFVVVVVRDDDLRAADIDTLADERCELRVFVCGKPAGDLKKAVAFGEDTEPSVFGDAFLRACDLLRRADSCGALLAEAGDLDDGPAHGRRRHAIRDRALRRKRHRGN